MSEIRHRGIELIAERCTSCMICVRECPVWCISLDSHTEPIPELAPGARERTRNVLDDFSIDWGRCQFCAVCIEQCPFEALQWSETAPGAARERQSLVHERQRLEAAPPAAP